MVGGALLDLLLKDPAYSPVFSLGRRRVPAESPKLTQRVVDFARLGPLPPADDVFCALGTTMATAKTKAAFRAADFDAVLALAKGAKEAGAERFFLISSSGANARSPFFYPRVKGEIEAAVAALGFEAVYLLRPSFLLGERADRRPKEAVLNAAMKALAPLIPRRYRAIEAQSVARAAMTLSHETPRGVRIVESDELAQLGQPL